MTVVEIGDLQTARGERFSGLVIQATRDELQEVAGNILYNEVVVSPAKLEDSAGENGNFWDGKFGEMVNALCAVNSRVLEAKPTRKYTRDEVLAMLDEIDPEGKTEGGAQ